MTSFSFHKNSSRQLGLFSFFLLAILFLASCKRPETDLGGDLIPEEDLLSALQTDTLSLTVTVEREDSLQTDNLSTVMLGTYADPVFGKSAASFYTQFHLSTSNPSFPANAVVDSVVLSLVYKDRAYGVPGTEKVTVHRMTESISRDSDYYSNQYTGYEPFSQVNPGEEYIRFDNQAIVVVGTDTVVPQLRIRLNPQLGYELLQLPASSLVSNEAFKEAFKGLYVTAGSQGTAAGVFNFDLVDASSKMTVYYHYDENGTDVNTRYDYNINTETGYYTYVQHNRNGTALAPLGQYQTISGTQYAYVQAGAGCKSRIDLPYLDRFGNYPNLSINRAQLIVPFEDSEKLSPQPALFLVYKDSTGELRILPDQILGNISGTADLVADQYVFNISLYIQRVLNGEIQSNGLYLVSQNAGVSVTRSLLHGPQFSTENKNRNMRMVLTFTH